MNCSYLCHFSRAETLRVPGSTPRDGFLIFIVVSIMWKPTLLLLLTVFIPSVSPTSDEDDVTEYEKDFHEFDQDADGSRDSVPPARLSS